jgi:hypothetical protein
VPSSPNRSAGDNAVASPVNAPLRNKFLLLIGEFANDFDMFPPLQRVAARTSSKNRGEFPVRAQPIYKNRMSISDS